MNSEEKLTAAAEEVKEAAAEEIKEAAEVIEDAANEAKEADIIDKIKESGLGRTILGEDGKFDKEDVERLAQGVKESKLGKAILGDDGKFDKEDVRRISGEADAAIKGAIDKVKDIFNN